MFNKKIMLALIFASFFCVEAYSQEDPFIDDADQVESEVYVDEEAQADADLRELEKFKDIAVIQKKFLDKTERFELYGSGVMALNSQFHNFLGINAVASYHFNERWGLELQGLFTTSIEKSITENLNKKQKIETKSIVVPKSYYGLNLRWSPIYGKMSLREQTINPFEMYFTLGLGLSKIEDGQNVGTLHLGLGQVYPLSKNTSFRWGFGYNFFQANARGDLKGSVKGKEVNTSFFYLNAGISVFLPFSEAR